MFFIIAIFIAIGSIFAADNAVIMDNFPALSVENPAYSSRGFAWQTDFYRPYAGIGTMMYSGGLSTKYGFSKTNIGLDIEYSSTDKYYQAQIAPGFGVKLGSFSIGIAPKLLLDGWNTGDFHYAGADNPEDPYFDDGNSNIGFSANVGVVWDAGFMKTGLYGENLLPTSLSSNETDRDAIEPSVNLTTQNRLFGGIFNVGLGYDMSAPDGKMINGAVGYTKGIGQRFALMSSFDWCSMILDAGLSINITKNTVLGYAFEYPFTEVGEVASSHRVCLSGSIVPRPKPERIPIPEPEIVEEIIEEPEEPVVMTEEKVEEEFEDKGEFTTTEIHFEFDEATLTPESDIILENIGNVFERHPDWKIEIAGHTDSDGPEWYNQRLSKNRAKAVKSYLIEKFDINPTNLSAVGFGESQPVADNETEEGRALNRRVVFRILE